MLTSVTGLVLYNADTNKPIQTLSNGSTINYAQIGTNHISIVANVDGSTRSVIFGVDSNSRFRNEGMAPYAINGDAQGNLNPWTPSLGSHTITATPYTGTYGTGIAGSQDRITINVINQASSSGGSSSSTSGNVVTGLVVYNADTNKPVQTLTNGGTINYAQIGTNHISIVATVGSGTKSVIFGLDSNSHFRDEGMAPYAINGDNNGDLNAWTPSLGSHTVTATPYAGSYGTGSAGSQYRVSFNVINQASSSSGSGSSSSVSGNTITGLVLYNADTNQPIQTLTNGATIDFSKIGTSHLSIVATTGTGTHSVIFGLDSNSRFRDEGMAPYAIAGDNNGDLNSWTPSLGNHTVTATPYSGSYGTGSVGSKYSISFNVTNSGSSSGGGTLDSNVPGGPHVVISAVETSITAGHAIFVNGLSSTLGSGTPLTAKYDWDFGDSGSKYNTLTGWNASHVYDRAGTYTVRLTITNDGHKVGSSSITINVGSANRRVIYVSGAGSDSGNGSSSSPVRTFAKAMTMVSDNTEILFRRNDTFTTSTAMVLTGRHNVVVGAYGSGNNPVIRYNGGLIDGAAIFGTGSGSDGITIQDLTLDSIYTSTNTYQGMPVGVGIGGINTTVRNVQFLNLSDGVNTNRQPKGVLVEDSSAPNGVRGYFAWVQGSDQAYIGNSCANSTYQHDLRDAGADRILIADNNFTNNFNNGVQKGCLTIHKGTYVYITGNTLNVGKLSIGPLGQGDGLNDKGARMDYVVAEDNRVTGLTLIETGAEHVMLRNNIMYRDTSTAIDVEGYSSTYGRGVVDLTIANNTAQNNGSSGNFLRVEGPVNGINLVNNLYLARNLLTGPEGASPVFVLQNDLSSFRTITNNVWCSPHIDSYAQGGINYVYSYWSNSQGYRTPSEWSAFGQVGTDYYENPSYSSSMTPSSSSKTATAGIQWAGVFTDFYGKARPISGSITAGAVQV